MATTKRGLASVSGLAGTYDVILYPVAQTMKATQNFELEIAKDVQGDDAAWKANNEMFDGDWAMKLLGDTAAHAKAGGAFLAPLAVVTISGCDLTFLNTTWIVVNGSDIDLGNTKMGDIVFKMRRYANTTQNTSFATTPA